MPSCLICSSKETRRIYPSTSFNLYRCLECSVIFVFPQPDSKKMDISNKEKYDSDHIETTYINMKNIFFDRANKYLKVLKKHKTGGNLLDIGCGYGFYMKVFDKAGFKTTGIDIAERSTKYAREVLKLNVTTINLDQVDFPKEHFDVISLFDVFEHLPDPQKSLETISSLLRQKGILIIQTPNYDSLISKITKLKWFWLVYPQHLLLYNLTSLRFILEKSGYKILYLSTWDDTYEFVSNILLLFGIKNEGKTGLLHWIIIKITKPFGFVTKTWNAFKLGGEIILFAQRP